MGYNSKELRVSKDPKKPSKPKDTDYVSKMGYRDDSPFRNQEAINIYTPNGTIDMSNTGIPLMANGRYLPPYSGQHRFNTTNVLEQRMASGGEVDADKAYSFLLAKSIYGHPLSAAQTRAFERIAGVRVDENGDIIEEGEEDDESVSYDDDDTEEMSYEKRGGSTRGKRTSKNIKTSVNKLLQRNAMLYGPSGKNLYDPSYKTGGLLDELPKAQVGVNWIPGAVSQSDSVRNMAGNQMRWEHSRGDRTGTGLSNYGNPDLAYALGRNPTEQEAVDDYMQKIYPQVKDKYPTAMEQVTAGDLLYNAGKEASNYLNWDTRKDPVASQQNWNHVQQTLDTDARRKALNNARDRYYKNTAPKDYKDPETGKTISYDYGKNPQGEFNKDNFGAISPAYENTWYGRQHASDQYKPYTEKDFTNKNNPLFYPKKQMGGWLDQYQVAGATGPKFDRSLMGEMSMPSETVQSQVAPLPYMLTSSKDPEKAFKKSKQVQQSKEQEQARIKQQGTLSQGYAEGDPRNPNFIEEPYYAALQNRPVGEHGSLALQNQMSAINQLSPQMYLTPPGMVAGVIQGGYELPKNVTEGNYGNALINLLQIAPGAKAFPTGYANVLNKVSKASGLSEAQIALGQQMRTSLPGALQELYNVANYYRPFKGALAPYAEKVGNIMKMPFKQMLSSGSRVPNFEGVSTYNPLKMIGNANLHDASTALSGAGAAKHFMDKTGPSYVYMNENPSFDNALSFIRNLGADAVNLIPVLNTKVSDLVAPVNWAGSDAIHKLERFLAGKLIKDPIKNEIKNVPTPLKKNGGASNNWLPNNYYQNGGTVAELWEEVTGTPWKEAAARGLTDGSYEMNMQLRKLLLGERAQLPVSHPAALPANAIHAPVRQQVPAKVQQAPMPRIDPSLMGAPNYRSESVQSQRGNLENPIERANAPVHAARIEKEKEDKRRERLIEQQKMDLARGQGKKLWDIDYEMRNDKAIEEHQAKINHMTNVGMAGLAAAPFIAEAIPAAMAGASSVMAIPEVSGAINAAMIYHGIKQAPETVKAWTDPTISKWDAAGQTALNVMDFAGIGYPLKAIAEASEVAKASKAYNSAYTGLNNIKKNIISSIEDAPRTTRNFITKPFDSMGQKIFKEYKPELFNTPGVIGPEEIQLNKAARKLGTRFNELDNPEYLAKLRREGYGKVKVETTPAIGKERAKFEMVDMATRELWNKKAQLFKEANLTDKELAAYNRTRKGVEADYQESLRLPTIHPKKALTEIELAEKSKNKNFYPKEKPLDLENRGMKDLSKTEIKNVMIDREANPLLTTQNIPGPTATTMDRIKTWSQNKMADLIRKNVLKPSFERNYMPLPTEEQQILAEHNKVLNKLFGNERSNPMRDIDAVKAFIKEQPRGYAFMGSGSLSDSSFPLYTMHAQRGIMANEIKPVFTGYAGLNESGHLFKYGVTPEVRADFINKSIQDFNASMGGKYKLPPAYVNEDKVVMYPQMSLIKKELGGQSMPYVHYQLGGGWLDQYQPGGATATDSANVYNSVIQSKNFYDGLGKYYKTPVITDDIPYYLDEIKSGKTQRQNLAHEDVTQANKNIIRANTNPNVQYFSDLVTGMIDPRAPLMMYDRRIKPQGVINYDPKSPFIDVLKSKGLSEWDTYDALTLFSESGNAVENSFQKEEIEKLSKLTKISIPVLHALYKNQEKIKNSLPGNITTIPYYDPQEVKPWNLRTPEEKLAFAKKHPNKSTQTNKAKPTVAAKAPVTVPVTKAVEKQVQTSPVAWQPKTFKPTGPTKYQTVSGTGQKYYFADGKPVNENEYNTYYKNLPEIDRTTGLPIGQQPITKKQMGGWLDQYQTAGPVWQDEGSKNLNIYGSDALLEIPKTGLIDRSLMDQPNFASETVQSQVAYKEDPFVKANNEAAAVERNRLAYIEQEKQRKANEEKTREETRTRVRAKNKSDVERLKKGLYYDTDGRPINPLYSEDILVDKDIAKGEYNDKIEHWTNVAGGIGVGALAGITAPLWAPVLAGAAGTVGSALELPAVIGNTTLPWLTGNNALAAYFASKIPKNIEEGEYLEAGLNALPFLGPGKTALREAVNESKGVLNKFMPKKINPVVGEQLQRLEGLGPVPPPPTYEQYAASNLDPVPRDVYERFNRIYQSGRTPAPVEQTPMNRVLTERWGNQANLVDPNRTSPYYNNRQVEIPRNFATELEGDEWMQAMEHNLGNDSQAYMNRALTNKYGPNDGIIALQNQVRSQAITPVEGYNRLHNALRAESNNYHNWTTTAETSNPVSRPAASYKPEIASLKEVKNVDKAVIDKVDKYMQRPIHTTGYQSYDTNSILGKVERVTSTNTIPTTAEIPDLITSFEKVYEKVKGKNPDLERKLRVQLEDLRGTNWLRTTGKAELEAQGLKPKELAIIDSGRGQLKNLVDKEGNIVGTVTLSGSDSNVISATGVNYKFHGYKLKDANAIKEAEAQLAERLLKDKATREALAEQHNFDNPFDDNLDWSQGVYDELMSPEYSNLYKPEAEKTLAQLLDNNQNRYGDMLYRGVHHAIKDTRGPLESHAHFVQTTLPDAISNAPKTLYRGKKHWDSGIDRGTYEQTPNGALRVVRKSGGEGWLDNY